jgi:hypothetical protein
MHPRTLTPDTQSIYCSVSASRARQSAQHPDSSGFTSAVRTQKTEDLAFANDHGNTVNVDGLAKAFSQSIQRNDRFNHGFGNDILVLNLRSACDMAPAIFYRRLLPWISQQLD